MPRKDTRREASATRITPHKDVVSRQVDDEMVLVHLTRNHVFALNATGARLWELISEGYSRPDAVERMLDEFEVPRRELEEEVASFVRLLIREDLVREEPD